MAELSQQQVDTVLAVVKLITVFLGFYIVYLGIRAYQKLRQKSILFLSIGMFILTIGAISEGLALQGLNWSQNQSHIFEGIVTLIGFTVLVYSLVTK